MLKEARERKKEREKERKTPYLSRGKSNHASKKRMELYI